MFPYLNPSLQPAPQKPPPQPDEPAIEIGRCAVCTSMTAHTCLSCRPKVFVCPRPECRKDHDP